MTFESVSRTYTEREPFNPLNKIKDAANKVGKGVNTAVDKTGKGINTAVNKTGGGLKEFSNIVLGPVWKFIQNIGAWLKFVFCMLCCLCIVSSCTSLGIPQMIFAAISAARRSRVGAGAGAETGTGMPEYAQSTYMQTP